MKLWLCDLEQVPLAAATRSYPPSAKIGCLASAIASRAGDGLQAWWMKLKAFYHAAWPNMLGSKDR